MNRMGQANTMGVVMDKLPRLSKIIGWFRGDEMNIDNHLFKLHYQASTMILALGFIVVSEKNYLDLPQKSILCHSEKSLSEYAKSYCWIHGTSYVRQALRGKATGCFVDQTKIESEEDAPVTAYYLWLPYLLAICFVLARLPRSAWKRFFENGLIRHILRGRSENMGGGNQRGGNQMNQQSCSPKKAGEIAENFFDFRSKYNKYHTWFALCEVLNIGCVLLSMGFCHWLLNYQFGLYGLKVLEYLGTPKRVNSIGVFITHDPMCELFPTEVACTLRYGATTGALDRSNFLCILGNNLFNQKYFFVLWLWWAVLLFLSCLGLVYRVARISVPGFSKVMLMRKVHGRQLERTTLSAAEYFVLDLMMQNMEDRQKDLVLEAIEKKFSLKRSPSLPSVICDTEVKGVSGGSSTSSGFGSGKGEMSKSDYVKLPQKSPSKQQQSPGKQSQGQDAVLKESYYPTKLLMGAAAGMGIGAGMAAASAPFYEQHLENQNCGSSSTTSEGTSVSISDSDSVSFSCVTFDTVSQTEV